MVFLRIKLIIYKVFSTEFDRGYFIKGIFFYYYFNVFRRSIFIQKYEEFRKEYYGFICLEVFGFIELDMKDLWGRNSFGISLNFL